MLMGVDMALVLSDFRGTLRIMDSSPAPDTQKSDSQTLPWWMNPLNIVLLVVAGIVLSGAVAFTVGESRGRGAHNGADIGFLQDMRIHHEQAVAMSLVYIDASSAGTPEGLASRSVLRLIAREIIVGQSAESGRMVQMLRQFKASETNETDQVMGWMNEPLPLSQMPGYATDAQLQQLRNARGKEVDTLFGQLMIAHHNGGIHMAEHASMHGKNSEITALAKVMATAQKSEVKELTGLIG